MRAGAARFYWPDGLYRYSAWQPGRTNALTADALRRRIKSSGISGIEKVCGFRKSAQAGEPREDRALECDAMVGPTVIGRDVHGGDFIPALRFDGAHEVVVRRRQAVVGGQNE